MFSANGYQGMGDDGFASYDQNSFAYLRHINVHDNLGLLQCEFKLDKDPIASKTEPGYITVNPNGDVLTFSRKSGKIYRRGSGKNKVINTNPNGAHIGAMYYNGIYFFIAKNGKLGWMRANDYSDVHWNHGTISNIRLNHVPFHPWYTKFYVGGSSDVYVMDMDIVGGKITPNTLTKTQLNIPFTWSITDFRDLDRDLIWGANAENSGAIGQYRRFSDSFHQVDKTDSSIHTFFGSSNSNIIFGLMGHRGDIIHYTGAQAVLRKRIPDVTVKHNPYADAIVNSRAMVAIGGRIYSYHQRKSGHPFALTHAYTCTGGDEAEIISIGQYNSTSGKDQLYVSWEKGDEFGFDSINYNEYADGLIVMPISEWFGESSHDQRYAKTFVEPKGRILVHYHHMPKNADIEIGAGVNEGVYSRTPKICNNTKHNKSRLFYQTNLSTLTKNGQKTRLIQPYVYLKPYKDETPMIRSIEVY